MFLCLGSFLFFVPEVAFRNSKVVRMLYYSIITKEVVITSFFNPMSNLFFWVVSL